MSVGQPFMCLGGESAIERQSITRGEEEENGRRLEIARLAAGLKALCAR